jgi:hypothetical protein
MKFKNFSYTKKDGEKKNYFVLMLDDSEDPKHFGGLDLSLLTEDEIKQIIETRKKYEESLRPFIKKSYKQFIKENVKDAIYSTDYKAESTST